MLSIACKLRRRLMMRRLEDQLHCKDTLRIGRLHIFDTGIRVVHLSVVVGRVSVAGLRGKLVFLINNTEKLRI
jgi:TRAP-type uncharacterized transport system fused permease subunit